MLLNLPILYFSSIKKLELVQLPSQTMKQA